MTRKELNSAPMVRHHGDRGMPPGLIAAYAAIARERREKRAALQQVRGPGEPLRVENPDPPVVPVSLEAASQNNSPMSRDVREVRYEQFRMGNIVCHADFLGLKMPGLNGLINVAVAYLLNPKAVRGIPYTPRREISYVAYRVFPEKGFLIKQSGFREQGRGETKLVTCFDELYSLHWVNAEGGMELEAIAEAFKTKNDVIQKHLECAINLGNE